MNFGRELKARRRELGLTQAELSNILSCGDPDGSPKKRAIEDWEAGRRTPMLVTQEGIIARLHSYRPAPEFRDIQEVSLPIFGIIPAGWPMDNQSARPKRTIKVPRGKYPRNAFGLDVKGNSMNNPIRSKFGPIQDGDIVVLEPFESAEKANKKIVAALSDGQTTLKRLTVLPGGRFELTSETEDLSANRKVVPEYDLVIQGVVIDRLDT